MKQKNVFKFMLLTLCMLSLTFTACNDDDDIQIEQLNGPWYVVNDDPNLAVDGLVKYTFTPTDGHHGTCEIYSYDALSSMSATTDYTYVLSQDQTLITFYETGDEHYNRQYWIKKLNGKEMRWENASPKDGNTMQIRLEKSKD